MSTRKPMARCLADSGDAVMGLAGILVSNWSSDPAGISVIIRTAVRGHRRHLQRDRDAAGAAWGKYVAGSANPTHAGW
jgi:hypothetical protein